MDRIRLINVKIEDRGFNICLKKFDIERFLFVDVYKKSERCFKEKQRKIN